MSQVRDRRVRSPSLSDALARGHGWLETGDLKARRSLEVSPVPGRQRGGA